MDAKLENALLSIRLAWDLSTPAKEIVERVREQDLSYVQSLEGKCKEHVLAVAFKLVRGLHVPAVVALLLLNMNGRSTNILNSVLKKEGISAASSAASAAGATPVKKSYEGGVSLISKKIDNNNVVNVLYRQGEAVTQNVLARKVDGIVEYPEGTIVDMVIGMALAHSNSCILNKLGAKYKSCVKEEESGDLWQGEGNSSLYGTSSGEIDASFHGYDVKYKRVKDWETSDSVLKDFSKWDESFQSFDPATLDSGEWEEVTSKSRKKTALPVVVAGSGPSSVMDSSKLRKTFSGSSDVVEKSVAGFSSTSYARAPNSEFGDDGEYNCEIARKLLECLLIFGPRLSGHAQSPHLPPLLRAAKENDESLVCLLLDATAPNKLANFVNEKDADGNTALHWALRQATPVNRRTVNSQVVRRLLKAGANVMTGNKLGATPVHTAAGHGHFEALSDILEKDSSGVNVLALTKETPLHYAVKNNHIACTFLLLKHGANRNVASSRNQKPIHLAPSVEMRALLLQDDKVLKDNTWESIKPILLSAASSSSPLYSLAMQSQTQFPFLSDACGFHQSNQDGMDWLSAQTLAINSRDFNLGGEMDMLGGKESVNLPQYKTVMCRFFASSEGCGWGSKCHFAHSEEELVGAERIDGQLMGAGGSLSDDGSEQSIKNFKTKLCTHHEKTGKCPHGAKCTFAHGMIELRNALSSAAICIRPPIGMIDARPSSANSVGSSTGSEKGDEYMSARKVFVGGLPHFIQSDDLSEFFEAEFGKVVDAVVICGVDTDGKVRSRGFGFVVFHDPRHANVAVKRHYLPFRGKNVEVKRAMARVDYGDVNSLTFPSISNNSLSPTFTPSSPVLNRSKETSSSVPLAVPQQQAWSLPPLAVDSLRKPSHEPSPSNSLGSSEMNNHHHIGPQFNTPPLSHLSLNHSGKFHSFGPLFSQDSNNNNNSFSLDSGLDRSSYLLDSSAAFVKPHHSSNGSSSSAPYSNGTTTSFENPRVHHDMDHQSFFSTTTPGPPLVYPSATPPVVADEEEEFSELLAMLQGDKD